MANTPHTSTSQAEHPTVSRDVLKRLTPVWVHRGRSLGQADVCAYETEGRRLVVKDFRRRPWWVRRWWGRWVLRREWARLERLQGISGIPRLLGWVDADAFAMEWIEGDRLPRRKDHFLRPIFFERLERLVAEMHARGVGHGDLRRKNILVDKGQNPYLIDFATACLAGPKRRHRHILERYCAVDRLKVAELKQAYCPDSLTNDERRSLDRLPLLLRFGSLVRKRVYRPFIKPRRWRHRWERLRRFLFGRRPDAK